MEIKFFKDLVEPICVIVLLKNSVEKYYFNYPFVYDSVLIWDRIRKEILKGWLNRLVSVMDLTIDRYSWRVFHDPQWKNIESYIKTYLGVRQKFIFVCSETSVSVYREYNWKKEFKKKHISEYFIDHVIDVRTGSRSEVFTFDSFNNEI